MQWNKRFFKIITALAVLPATLLSAVTPITTPNIPHPVPDSRKPYNLRQPSNITTETYYDPERKMFLIRTRLGNREITTPFMLSPEEYSIYAQRNEMGEYFNKRNSEAFKKGDKKPFNVLDMNFALGPLDNIFGPGGVKLSTQGSMQISSGIKSNRTDNPALSLRNRRKTYFDFDQKIQATINASVGDKLKFNMSYNTDATFDFDSKNLRLNYEGKEDEIIKSIEAGNISMTTGSSLMRGGTALFGLKSKIQLGKLTLTGILSQQNSQSQSISTKGGVQSTKFSIKADNYDANRHFFLAQYFYQNYDRFAAHLPIVASGIRINRIEVWITNKSNNFNESRNLVAFMDLGENSRLGNTLWRPSTDSMPSNRSNNLLEIINNDYPEARNINTVTQALAPLQASGIVGGKDYEKVESARLLKPNEYTLNAELGYISLKSALNSDEVLAVAYEYTSGGKVYQVGEFSSDISSTDQSLYLKMLRATTISPQLPIWRLMMKNVYSLGAYQLQSSNFKFNIKFLSDTTGTELNYLPVGRIANLPLLQVMNLDNIDSNQEHNSDGFFDYIEGYTVQSSAGEVIFPVAEPFGSHLARKLGDAQLADHYCYRELYDSTLVVARQFADKNKFSFEGEYQAAGGATIRLQAMNVPRGSVIVTAGGAQLTENTDYTVDYAMGVVTIINQSIIDSGTSINVSLENQSLFSMQRKNLMGIDAQYALSNNLNLGATLMHFSEKALTQKVNIGEEIINNSIWGTNLSYNKEFMWLTDLLNRIPSVNLKSPSRLNLKAEFAQLTPHTKSSGSNNGSSYIDDFESTQTSIDLRSPYSWFLASTPYENSKDALFPEASLINNIDYGKNRALLSWYFIDRFWTQKNSSMIPSYMRNDLHQLSNPYVREIKLDEIYPYRDLAYGEANYIQTLNLSFYPQERGPYNLDADNIGNDGTLLNPERRWGGIMRKMENPNFEASNVEYLQFWLMDPFLDNENPNTSGGDLYFNLGEISEDILKDGKKSYENGLSIDGHNEFMETTVWGRTARQNSLTYAFENAPNARILQDVGLDGLSNDDEFSFPSYKNYLDKLKMKLRPEMIEQMQDNPFSAFSDPAGDNYHFFRSNYYDAQKAGILERYKRYNGVEGNSLSPEQSDNPQYQSARTVPDVEDINQDNTLNEYERYFQYHVSLRPEDLEVGKNHIVEKIEREVSTREGRQATIWYLFKIPLNQPQKVIGGISDFTTIRFARIFMTGFSRPTHLRFATLELVRGEWRDYKFNLNNRNDSPAEGELDLSVVNIEENSGRTPVNYILPPGVDRIQDPGQSQATQLNEQSLSMKLSDLRPGDARGIYKATQTDLRIYRRLQMWIHAEADMDNSTNLKNGDISLFIRLGSDVKNNYYEYEIPLNLTLPGHYNNYSSADRMKVWPASNFLNIPLSVFTTLKSERNHDLSAGINEVGYTKLFSKLDPENNRNIVTIMGNPSLSDVRIMLIGIRNKSNSIKNATVWVNELKVTDFNESGGWAMNTNLNLALSELANINFAAHRETAGFGSVDQSLAARRLDDYQQYNIALQADPGKILPRKLALNAPIYFAKSREMITPKYNPLDQDMLLSDALDAANTAREKDSIMQYALTQKSIESFSLSNLKFNIRNKKALPWDLSNFQLSLSYNKQRSQTPTTQYELTNDYRGNLQYSWSPLITPLQPFSRLKGKGKLASFLREWNINWLFNNLTLYNGINRYYYEQQSQSAIDYDFQLPLQVSKNFTWNRQLSLNWNIIKSLNLAFSNNTLARIEEGIGAVNKRLFPDRYSQWKDTVLSSLRNLGTPWNYNQTFNASYRPPLSKLPGLDFITASATYNSVYRWDRGATTNGLYMGNSIQNQTSLTADMRFALDMLYNKSAILKRINSRFSNSTYARNANSSKPLQRKYERAIKLLSDTSTIVRHNMNSKKIILSAIAGGKTFIPKYRVIDNNNVEILDRGEQTLTVTIKERREEKNNTFSDFGDYALRLFMMPRSVNIRIRNTHSLNLPLFLPEIGGFWGQSSDFGPMSPGLDFAFGLYDQKYVKTAFEKGWLLSETNQISPSIWNRGREYNFEINLEPIRNLKILLTSNLTDNRTEQTQFIFAGMPTNYSGSYLRTHLALASALRSSKAETGYASRAFSDMLEYIPLIADRFENEYANSRYPSSGFMKGNPLANQPFNPANGTVSPTSSDILIPAFLAAYSGRKPNEISLSQFGGFSSVRPNWRVTYDGLQNIGSLKNIFKSIQINHAYQCTYAIGSYTSFMNVAYDQEGRSYILNEQTQQPVPSSPFNITSVAINEKFAPLFGIRAILPNDMTINAEYRDARTLNLNTSAGQVVEVVSHQIAFGAGYKIANFNQILKIGSQQGGVSNDLSINLDFTFAGNSALIRKIETAYTQATNGTQTMSINLMASYNMSRRITLSAFFDHQTNTPLVSNSAYPTSNSNYGIAINISLAR